MGIYIKNRQAYYNYTIVEKYVAGIVLVGAEVKSIRASKVSLKEAYCHFVKGELWVKNMHISEYSLSRIDTPKPERDKKLMLTKRELKKIFKQHKEKGLSIIPLAIMEKNRYIKMEIGLGKGKKLFDKRESIKKKDLDRRSFDMHIT